MKKLTPFLLFAAAACGGATDRSYYTPQAYTERANAFIERGLVTADCSADSVRLRTHLENASPDDVSWFQDSYLSTDVERFNQDPQAFGWLFLVDEFCRLQSVNAAAHTVRLPFGTDTPWLGTVYYGGRLPGAVLRSSTREMAFRASETSVPEARLGETFVGAPDSLDAESGVRINFGPLGPPAADVFLVGSNVVLQSRTGTGGVRVMGHVLPEARVLRLEGGDWVSFRTAQGAEETFVLHDERSLREASRVRQRNLQFTRVTDDPGLGLYVGTFPDEDVPFLELLPRSLDASRLVLNNRGGPAVDAFDVQLTLDRQVQRRVGHAFEAFVRQVQRQQPHLAPVAAGLTVMDGRSGKLLSLNTFPRESDVATVPFLEPGTRRRMLVNQNFIPHPIGSAGKPFLFAAILDRHPLFLGLTLPPHPTEEAEPRRRVLHCMLPAGYEVHGSATPVDVPTALEISSNRFTVELAVLALGETSAGALLPDRAVDWPGTQAGSEMHLNGNPLAAAPSLGRYLVDAAPVPAGGRLPAQRECTRLNRLEQAPFAARLEDITGVSTYQGRRPTGMPADSGAMLYERYITGRYDLRVWSPLLGRITAGASENEVWAVRTAFQGASPERVNLGFNRMRDFRQDYVTFLLGGGRSLWTNVQLAEAMSRLLIDRQVEPHLLSAILPHASGNAPPALASPSAPERLLLDPAVRSAVLSGMARVVEGDRGTALELAPRIRELRAAFPGDRVLIFAKTGSPRFVREVPAEVGQALTNLVATGRLTFQNGVLLAQSRRLQVPYARPERPERPEFERALRGALLETRWRRSPDVVLPLILMALDDFADQVSAAAGPNEILGPLRVGARGLATNRSDDFFSRHLMRLPGAVFVFTLVRIPGAGPAIPTPEELQRPDARVITVAIHLAAGPDSKLAVRAANTVFPELAALLRD